jgi:transcriptional regulator with XRE-family HTH domain
MQRLESERRRLGLTKSELARLSRLNVTTVIEATNEKRTPGDIQLVKFAKGLGWPVDRASELLDEVEDDA